MENLTLWLIISAAATDSINPCAIGVLVFMITFLAGLKGSKKKILGIGLTYISIVYLSYFLAGLGLLEILEIIPFLEIIYRVIGGLLIIGGIIDIYDGITKNKKPLLSIPSKTSPTIKKYIKKATIPAAIILGGLVSLFELPCTGGVYFAILGVISKTDYGLRGIAYLALYNFIFILPLLILLFLAVFGLSPEKLSEWRKKNRNYMRIIVGASMMILGILMVSNVI